MVPATPQILVERKPIHILYIEDNPNDFLLVQRLLAQLGREEGEARQFELERADRVSKGLDRLAKGGVDLVLTDLNLPDSHELEAVTMLHSHFPTLPIIALTNAYTRTLGLMAVRKGAQDYLLKDELTGHLIRQSICYAIERNRLEKVKDEFISTVSHELMTPLTIIKGGIGVLNMGAAGAITQKQGEILTSINQSINHLERIVRNILDLSRLESGHSTIARVKLSLRSIIQQIVAQFQGEFEKKHLVIEANLPDLPDVFADPNLLIQVLTNLLSNASRYAQKKISITAQLLNDRVCIRVIDDGPGIAPEDQKKLFNKFVQINRPQGGQNYKGTGLGLAICKEIIQQHEGEIWIESTVGQGAQFCFTIPLSADHN